MEKDVEDQLGEVQQVEGAQFETDDWEVDGPWQDGLKVEDDQQAMDGLHADEQHVGEQQVQCEP